MLCRKLLRVEESGGEVQVWRLCPPEEQEDREQDQVACRGEAERSPSPFLMFRMQQVHASAHPGEPRH